MNRHHKQRCIAFESEQKTRLRETVIRGYIMRLLSFQTGIERLNDERMSIMLTFTHSRMSEHQMII